MSSNIDNFNLSTFDTGKVTDMSGMFYGCSGLTSLDVSNFDTRNVTSMRNMFCNCSSLTGLDLGSFITKRVMSMDYMFSGCSGLTELDLTSFETSNVYDMSSMFSGCSALISLDLSSFNTKTVYTVQLMFENCSSLKTIYASSLFDLRRVEANYYYLNMFRGDTKLVGGNGTAFSNTNLTGKDYARVDLPDQPGYFTARNMPPDIQAYNMVEICSSTSPNCTLERLDDKTWTYTFAGLDPHVQYYAWEDVLENYTSLNMGMENYLTVKNGNGTITNVSTVSPPKGSLTVAKNVLNKDGSDAISNADRLRSFRFTVTLTDENGDVITEPVLELAARQVIGGETVEGSLLFDAGVAVFRLADDDSMTILDIPAGYHYTVEETPEEDFDMSVTTGTATGDIESAMTKEVVVTNRKKYDELAEDVSLTLTKAVIGNAVNTTDEFDFSIHFEGLRPNAYYTIASNMREATNYRAEENGSLTVDLRLKNNESVSLRIPADTTYVVTEAAGNYKASYHMIIRNGTKVTNKSGGNNEEGLALSTPRQTVETGDTIDIVFTNEKMITQKLTIEKHLENASGENADRFNFTVVIKGLEEGYALYFDGSKFVAGSDGEITIPFSRTQNDPAEIIGIPVGAKYEVTEEESDYVASCLVRYQYYDDAEQAYKYATICSPANDLPGKSLSTAEQEIVENQDPEVIFTNRKVSCDFTIAKQINMRYGVLTENQYKKDSFLFDVQLAGLSAGGKKYSEIIVEYSEANTTGTLKKTLAEVMGLSDALAEEQASSASFTLTLHHGEAIKIKSLPYRATCLVTERSSSSYIASYTISGNDTAVLQAENRSNSAVDQALSMNTAEIIDVNDKDLVVTFTNKYEFQPYVLPAAGTTDKRIALLIFAVIFAVTSTTYLYVNRRKGKRAE